MQKRNWARTIVIILMLLVVLAALGCSNSQEKPVVKEPPKPKIPSDIANTATDVLNAYMDNDWQSLYDLLHPDIQSTVTREEFIKLRSEAKSRMKVKYKGFALEKHKILKSWRNPADQNMLFENVAEVSYMVTVETPSGKEDIKNYLYLVKGYDGKQWTYLWPKN